MLEGLRGKAQKIFDSISPVPPLEAEWAKRVIENRDSDEMIPREDMLFYINIRRFELNREREHNKAIDNMGIGRVGPNLKIEFELYELDHPELEVLLPRMEKRAEADLARLERNKKTS